MLRDYIKSILELHCTQASGSSSRSVVDIAAEERRALKISANSLEKEQWRLFKVVTRRYDCYEHASIETVSSYSIFQLTASLFKPLLTARLDIARSYNL
jgi:hypothetical protein